MAAPSIFVFNEAYYLSQNPDVAAAVAAGVFKSGLVHWQAYGWAEGRTASRFFDWQIYRDNNPDLVEAGITTPVQLTAHFNTYGVHEGRVFMNTGLFDYEYYAEHNPDLAAAGITTPEALQQHFQQYGVYEGRVASPLIDGASYVAQNADLNALLTAGGNLGGFTNWDQAGIWHYYNYGINEGRSLGSARVDPPPATPDPAPTVASSQPITVTDANHDSVYNGGDIVHLRFSEPVSAAILAGASLGVPGTLSPVGAVNGYATEFQVVLAPGASILAGNVISIGKQYVVDQAGQPATSDVGFQLPSLPRTSPQYPAFELSLAVGDDAYINTLEVSTMTGITATVSSSVIRSLVISGASGSQQLQETAVWNPSTETYEFNATDFDDGALTVLATDVYSQTRTFTLTKDTVAPTIMAFSVAGPTSLSVTSSESGSAGLYNGGLLISGTGTPIAAANTPTTLSVAAQVSVVTATMQVFDAAGTGASSTTAVVLGTSGADVPMTGSTGPDFMFGFGGNDSIIGGESNDVIYGGADNDTIIGGAGNDSLYGSEGNDLFDYDAGASPYTSGVQPRYDTVDGGDGTDTILAWAGVGAQIGADLTDADFANVSNMEAITLASGSYSASVVLGTYANSAFANGVTVTIDPATTVNATVNGSAYTHNMTVTGAAQNDSITGGSGSDSLVGGNGNDTLTGGGGNDTMTGGAGFNTFNVDDVTDTITDLKAGDTLNVGWGAYAYVSLLDLTTAIVNNNGSIYVTGSSGADSIAGSSGLDIINGAGGNDTIIGGSGSDQLYGDEGNDVFVYTDNFALDADIMVNGGDGTDRIQFTSALTNPGNFHTYFAHSSSIEQVQLFGANSVNVGTGFQTAGITTVITGDDNTTLKYDDPVVGTITVDTTYLADDKTLTLTEFGPTTQGMHAFAVTNLKGNVNASAIDGWGTGRISVTAASGMGFAVSVIGGGGADTITGGLGDDTIDGAAGNDTITGGAGADSLTGGLGIDEFNVDAGIDTITDLGTGGADVVKVLATATANATVINAAGYTATDDSSNLGNLNVTLAASVDAVGNTVSFADLTDGGVNLTGNNEDNILIGSAQADTITGGAGADSLTGGGGADTFLYVNAAQLLAAGALVDAAIAGDGGTDRISVAGGLTVADTGVWTNATSIEELFVTGTAASTIVLGTTAETAGIATINISTSATDGNVVDVSDYTTVAATIVGSTANTNTLTGGALADTITGGSSADTITGGAGADIIDVQSGADVVRYSAINQSAVITSVATGQVYTDVDIVTGMGAADILAVFGAAVTAGSGYGTQPGPLADGVFNATVSTSALVNNGASLIQGNYNTLTGAWTASATGVDTLFVYDQNPLAASTSYVGVILDGSAGLTGLVSISAPDVYVTLA